MLRLAFPRRVSTLLLLVGYHPVSMLLLAGYRRVSKRRRRAVGSHLDPCRAEAA